MWLGGVLGCGVVGCGVARGWCCRVRRCSRNDKYFTDPVQWSVDNDASPGIDGDCFSPDAPVSRGEAAVYIWNMEGQPSAPSHSFIDVTDESQNAAVSWMSHNQITTGTTPTTFEPDTTLTRAHLVTFLHRLIGEPEAPVHPFVDVHASWQQNSVSWASHTEITTGTSPTTFEPDNTLTRAHLVTFLWRYKGKPEVTVDPDTPRCDPSSTDETDEDETDEDETDEDETDEDETDEDETDEDEAVCAFAQTKTKQTKTKQTKTKQTKTKQTKTKQTKTKQTKTKQTKTKQTKTKQTKTKQTKTKQRTPTECSPRSPSDQTIRAQ